jgi:hypothetical protein
MLRTRALLASSLNQSARPEDRGRLRDQVGHRPSGGFVNCRMQHRPLVISGICEGFRHFIVYSSIYISRVEAADNGFQKISD